MTLLGYERFDAVDGNGQFSLRGGILDFFMPDAEHPIRAEFWGDEISDLSYFDIETQRRFKKAGKIKLTPSTEIILRMVFCFLLNLFFFCLNSISFK